MSENFALTSTCFYQLDVHYFDAFTGKKKTCTLVVDPVEPLSKIMKFAAQLSDSINSRKKTKGKGGGGGSGFNVPSFAGAGSSIAGAGSSLASGLFSNLISTTMVVDVCCCFPCTGVHKLNDKAGAPCPAVGSYCLACCSVAYVPPLATLFYAVKIGKEGCVGATLKSVFCCPCFTNQMIQEDY